MNVVWLTHLHVLYIGDNTFGASPHPSRSHSGRKPQQPPKEKKRHVAPEHGFGGGLNDEYKFSPRQGEGYGEPESEEEEDDLPKFKFTSDDEENYYNNYNHSEDELGGFILN